MMIIDPNRDGCEVWFDFKVQNIRGNPDECCFRILRFLSHRGLVKKLDTWKILYDYNGNKHKVNYTTSIDIGIDTSGFGRMFGDAFSRVGVLYNDIKPYHYIE